MSLTNRQYDEIMREYDAISSRNHRIQSERIEEVNRKVPEYAAANAKLQRLRMQKLNALLKGGDTLSDYEAEKDRLIKERDRLLTDNGFDVNYLKPIYTCPDCMDTGYLTGTRKKCKCFKQKIAKLLMDESGMSHLLQHQSFATLSMKGLNEAETEELKRAVTYSKEFIKNFDSDYQNVIFYGNVGTGKTFLSSCIAGELLKSGHSVLYFSATDLFTEINSARFSYDGEGFRDFLEDLYAADLLIIDDLGTEKTTDRTIADLFQLLNSRDQRRKSTLISTNLDLAKLTVLYSERISSRLGGGFKGYGFNGRDRRFTVNERNEKERPIHHVQT